jgi:hypothetical protein
MKRLMTSSCTLRSPSVIVGQIVASARSSGDRMQRKPHRCEPAEARRNQYLAAHRMLTVRFSAASIALRFVQIVADH